jgi:hypothetical protein
MLFCIDSQNVGENIFENLKITLESKCFHMFVLNEGKNNVPAIASFKA